MDLHEALAHAVRDVAAPGLLGPVLSILAVGAGAMLLAWMSVPILRRAVLRPAEQTSLVEYLPFDAVTEDGRLLKTKSGALTALIKLRGLSMESLDPVKRRSETIARTQMLHNLAGKGIVLQRFTVKARGPLDVMHDRPAHPVRGALYNAWHEACRDAWGVEHYLCLTVEAGTEHGRDCLEEAVRETLSTLAVFSPSLVPAEGRNGDRAASALQFWFDLINPDRRGEVIIGDGPLDRRVYGGPVEIDLATGLIVVEGSDPVARCYTQIVSVSGIEETSDDVMVDLLALPCALVISQHMQIYSEAVGEAVIKRTRGMVSAVGSSQEDKDQFEAALSMISRTSTTREYLVDHELLILCRGASPEEAFDAAIAVRALLQEKKLKSVIARQEAQALWFSLLPGHGYFVRRMPLLTRNVADLHVFETPPQGLKASDFGPRPVAIFPTAGRMPYRFTYHAEPGLEMLGHMLIFGRARSGKSAFMMLTAACALEQHPDLRVFVLDRDHGALVWTLAIGGAYLSLNSSRGRLARSNPLARYAGRPLLDDELLYLNRFLLSLTVSLNARTSQYEPLEDAETNAFIQRMISAIGQMEPAECSLAAVLKEVVKDGNEPHLALLQRFTTGTYSRIFSETDDFSLDERLTTLDLTGVVEEPVMGTPVLFDFFERIEAACSRDGKRKPCLLIVDETAPALENPIFCRYLKDYLQRGGKKHQAIVLMFQEIGALSAIAGRDPALYAAIKENTPTRFFFRNPGGDQRRYEDFGVNAQGWDFISGSSHQHLAYAGLLVRPHQHQSVILNLDHGHMGELALLLKSGKRFGDAMLDALRRHGEGERGITAYLDAARQLMTQEID